MGGKITKEPPIASPHCPQGSPGELSDQVTCSAEHRKWGALSCAGQHRALGKLMP